MHHFLVVSRILLDAITHHAIERRVNVNECTVLVKTLEDLVLARFKQPQESFWSLCYSLNCWLIVSWFSRHSCSRSRSIS